jgi:hypothetical protein
MPYVYKTSGFLLEVGRKFTRTTAASVVIPGVKIALHTSCIHNFLHYHGLRKMKLVQKKKLGSKEVTKCAHLELFP